MWKYARTRVTNTERRMSTVPRELVPLGDYCLGMPVVQRHTPPGALPSAGSNTPEFFLLDEPAQTIALGTLLVLEDLFADGYWLSDIGDETFLVNPRDSSVFLSPKGSAAVAKLSDHPITGCQQADTCISSLANLLEKVLFLDNKLSPLVVPEFGWGLLTMMRNGGNAMWYAILNHISLVPLENRRELYLRIYDQLYDVVRVQSPVEYASILEELVFPMDWHKLVAPEKNCLLYILYCGSVYDSTAETKAEQAENIGRFMRNSGTHVLGAAGIKIGRTDVALMHHSLAPLFTMSLMRGLQRRGWLASTEIHSLFVHGR